MSHQKSPYHEGVRQPLLPKKKGVVILLSLTVLSVLFWLISSADKWTAREVGSQKTTTTTTAAQPVQPTSRTIQVGKGWTEVKGLPRCQFRIDPLPNRRLEARLLDKRVFEKFNGQWYFNNQPVEGFGVVPGFSIFLQSKDGNPMDVVFSTWPKSSG